MEDAYQGYKGRSLDYLKENKVGVGDSVEITTKDSYNGAGQLTYTGFLMPRYESPDDTHIVLKLENGYNVGLDISNIKSIRQIPPQTKTGEAHKTHHAKVPEKLPKVMLLSTGGTIASKVDYRTGAVTPTLTADELYESVPELSSTAKIDTEVLISEYSENIIPEHWIKIARRLDELAGSDYDGIVIAHGTDTMQYTASFLSFALAGYPIPVAVVGSQRSPDRPSSDAALNLISAVKFVTRCKTRGIFVVMHYNESDETIACHIGTRVRKNHTSKRGAFETIGSIPAFFIRESQDKIEKNTDREVFAQKEYIPRISIDTSVALIKYYPGFDPGIFEFLISSNYKAIIIEGTGLGHIGKTMYDIVKKAHDAGIFLGMTSQCIDGRVRMTVYESGRDLLKSGITPLRDIISETALVKAMWCLANSGSMDEFKELMLKNIASEFSD